MIRFPSFPFMTSKTLAELKPTPAEPRSTFQIAQDVTGKAIDKLAARKKELEASIALASAELAHTASTLEALGQARQSFREGNTKHTAAQLKDAKIADLIVDGSLSPYALQSAPFNPEDMRITAEDLVKDDNGPFANDIAQRVYAPAMDARPRHSSAKTADEPVIAPFLK